TDTKCTDSDETDAYPDGKNYYVKGHSRGYYWYNGDTSQPIFETDDYCGCINNDCSKRGLWEYYCSDSTVLTREAVDCNCVDGACIASATDYSCTIGQKVGDVNGDGVVDKADAELILQIVAELKPMPIDICCGDVDNNGKIQAYDASLVLQGKATGTCPLSGNQLKADFFKNDLIAKNIASGTDTYDMNDFSHVCGLQSGKSNEYGFKILNGIKQLGYLNVKSCQTAGDRPGLIMLRDFKIHNNLQDTGIVDKDTIIKLDDLLYSVEIRDKAIGPSFTCYQYIKDAPLNDVSKDHLAFLYKLAMDVYPEEYRIKQNECFNGQTYPMPFDYSRVLCDQSYWPAYDGYCNDQGTYDLDGSISIDDSLLVNREVHDQAHFIDGNVYGKLNKVDTTQFYNISYYIDDSFIGQSDGWRYYKIRTDMSDHEQVKANFFQYGQGWESNSRPGYYTAYEDFAVSIEMYVMQGIVFRDYMSDKPALAAKYNWIKNNVFYGKEFNTGDPNYKSYVPDLSQIGHGIGAAGGIAEMRPNYVWDYKID
ncbi:MAG: dockerin type I repeat-containing protein, partial [Candidatus Aenigmarchaeota archaeon]|nr:dockerin type I repeat-containing protein [Candidatus Aenigmarchaeota archaeon]